MKKNWSFGISCSSCYRITIMMFRVDETSDAPLFEQLASQVRLAIATGELRVGDRLPSAGQLAEALSVNIHTVLHAYQVLRDEGCIDLRRGRGAIVTQEIRLQEHDVNTALKAFAAAAQAAGLSTETTLELLRATLETNEKET